MKYIHLFWTERLFSTEVKFACSFPADPNHIPPNSYHFENANQLWITLSEVPCLDIEDPEKTYCINYWELEDAVFDLIEGNPIPVGRRKSYCPELN